MDILCLYGGENTSFSQLNSIYIFLIGFQVKTLNLNKSIHPELGTAQLHLFLLLDYKKCKFITSSRSTTLLCRVQCLHFVSLNINSLARRSALHVSSLAIFPITLWSQMQPKQVETNQTVGSSIDSVAGMFRISTDRSTKKKLCEVQNIQQPY